MYIPCRACNSTKIVFDEKLTNWFDWKGNSNARQLFIYGHKRRQDGCFVNIHNEIASMVFQCNTNVVAGVDGGSIM